jgi:protein TonB
VGRLIVDVAMVQAQAPPPPPPDVPTFTRAPIAFNTLAIPTNIPTFIPPPSQAPFDASRFSGFGAEVASPWGRETAARPAVSTDAVYAAEALEERPERIGGPAPQYPDLLRNAGIGGHVRVEFIIDTLGRVEPGSVQILESTHELFSQAVRGVVPLWLFRPGRMGGQAVKARARMPVEFVRVQT